MKSREVPRRNGVKPATVLSLPISHELKDAIGEAADDAGMAMNEWVAKIIAEYFGRPDLASIPRKPFGRPRTVHVIKKKLAGAGS